MEGGLLFEKQKLYRPEYSLSSTKKIENSNYNKFM